MLARDAIITLFLGSHLPYSLREVSDVLHIQGQPSTKSPSAISSTLAPWQPTATEGASKFRVSMEAVKVETHCLSFTVWPDRVGGLVNLSPDLAVGVTWFSNLAGLAAWVVGRSFWVLVCSLAEGTVVWSAGGVSVGLGWVSLTSDIAGEAVESAGEAPLSLISALDLYLGDGKMLSSAHWVSVGWNHASPTPVMVGEVTESAYGISVSQPWASGMALPKLLRMSCLLRVMYPPCATSILPHSSKKGNNHWMPADWLPLPNIAVPKHRLG